MNHGLLRNLAVLDQAQAKLNDLIWRSAKPKDRVRCLDATNGAHFLRVGQVYEIDQMQWDEERGGWRVCLVGMARAWTVERFEKVID